MTYKQALKVILNYLGLIASEGVYFALKNNFLKFFLKVSTLKDNIHVRINLILKYEFPSLFTGGIHMIAFYIHDFLCSKQGK